MAEAAASASMRAKVTEVEFANGNANNASKR
jgi:hypothetical protein